MSWSCECCGKPNLVSYPRPYTEDEQSYGWIDEDAVEMRAGDTIYDQIDLCGDCNDLLRKRNWIKLARRQRGRKA